MKALSLALSLMCLTSCGNHSRKANGDALVRAKHDHLEVLFFQSPQRCIICDNIKTRTQELLDSLYANEMTNGEIVFTIIDISKRENESVADSYEAAWTSLFINNWSNGVETRRNITEYAISYSMRPANEFKEGLKNKIEESREH